MTRQTSLARVFKGILFSGLLLFCLVAPASGQTTPASSTTLSSNAVMGFETPLAWTAKSSTSSKITVSSTAIRTQGSFAYAISNPGNLVALTSAPVASTATALAGLGNAGALFQVDVFLPALVGNTNNTGQLQMFVNSPSRGLSKVLVGDVLFSSFRPGIYNTLKFPIPSAVATALAGGSFSDLTFIFMISSPGQVTGPYLFDNLRVHSVRLVTADATTQVPPGYGGSVDFVVFGGTPVTQSFEIGVVQVPEDFHLKLGTAGTTTVQLELGYEGTPSFTCTYGLNATDTTDKSYILTSCTGGMQAGDLIGADWASLAIVGGDPSMKIRAQLAKNPVGDTAGVGIIPAMPTFWGDFDGCVPSLVTIVPGGVQPPFTAVANPNPPPAFIPTPSASCAAQTIQANQIATNYFNKFRNSQFPYNWVVAPTPELARRNGNGSPHNSTGPPPPGDPPFSYNGHVNDPPGGDWDAYYTLDGNFDPGTPGASISSSFNANMSGHVVLYGNDINVVSVQVAAATNISATNLGSPTGTASAHVYVFGGEIPITNSSDGSVDSGGNVDPGIGFDIDPGSDQSFPGVSLQIWIFNISVDGDISAGLKATGKIAADGLHLSFGPHVGVGAHAFGGVNVGFASGGVNVDIPDLFHADIMAKADAFWLVNTDPTQCTVGVNSQAQATASIGSGGGHVKLVASIGDCPFCWDDSWDVFDWGGLGDTGTVPPLFDTGLQQIAAIELPSPTTTCAPPLNVTISAQSPVPVKIADGFVASASVGNVTVLCTNDNHNPPARTWNWSSSVAGDILPQGCNGPVTFATTGTRTITLTVTDTVRDQAQTPIPLSGSSKPFTVLVNDLPAGVYISNVIPPNNIVSFNGSGYSSDPTTPPFVSFFSVPLDDMFTSNCGPGGCFGGGPGEGPLTVVGTISKAPGATSTTWTVTDTVTNTATMPLMNDAANPSMLVWTPPNLNHAYSITVRTLAGGVVFGTSTVSVNFVSLH